MMNSKLIPYTLFEGHYHLGVGVWLNSLYASGFRGEAAVGFRGPLPPWALNATSHADSILFEVKDDFVVKFVPYDPPIHFSVAKPAFALRLLANTDSAGVLYFDPDVVVTAPWAFFENWIHKGIALCEDCSYSPMPADHPHRLDWMDHAAKLGHKVCRSLSQYFNTGFVGVAAENRRVLEIWDELIQSLPSVGGALDRLKPGDRSMPFFGTDQDMLNLAVMITDRALSTIGAEGMAFKPGFCVMAHAVSSAKPWKKDYLRSALQGVPPSFAEKAYWSFADGPIKVYPESVLARTRRNVKIASAIGRFYCRR